MSSLSESFEDFFHGMVDGATGHANCLYCDKNSQTDEGVWSNGGRTWMCTEHHEEDVKRQEEERKEEIERQKERIRKNPRGWHFEYEVNAGDVVDINGVDCKVLEASYSDEHGTDYQYIPAGWFAVVDVIE